MNPKNCREGRREKYAFDDGKRNQTRGELRGRRVNPPQTPVRLRSYSRHRTQSVEQPQLFGAVAHKLLDKEAVSLRVDVFPATQTCYCLVHISREPYSHHNLKPVETPSFGDLHLCAEASGKVLDYDSVRCGEEGKDCRQKRPLIVSEQFPPVVGVVSEVDVSGSPERCLSEFVGFPQLQRLRVPLCDRCDAHLRPAAGWGREQIVKAPERGWVRSAQCRGTGEQPWRVLPTCSGRAHAFIYIMSILYPDKNDRWSSSDILILIE